RLLCGTLLPAPATVLQDVPGPNAANTTRERFQQHQADPACTGCHQQMDPIGFGLENFDAIGRYRDKDGTFPVDASGKIFGGGDAEGDFKGFRELSQRLAASKTVSDCITRQMFQYSFGRAPDAEDKGTLESSSSQFTMANKNLKEIVLAFIAADSFTKR
ncbi:MAG: DUF1588 domain-containing protein, partial [Polyangiaceae bacterium]|nr:DUF1588 domain-containing protein [Polyangiaceae bacterium]